MMTPYLEKIPDRTFSILCGTAICHHLRSLDQKVTPPASVAQQEKKEPEANEKQLLDP